MASLAANSIGFIGLGAMGMWMASHLAEKVSKSTKLYVFDIVPALVDDICLKYPDTVIKSTNPKELIDHSV